MENYAVKYPPLRLQAHPGLLPRARISTKELLTVWQGYLPERLLLGNVPYAVGDSRIEGSICNDSSLFPPRMSRVFPNGEWIFEKGIQFIRDLVGCQNLLSWWSAFVTRLTINLLFRVIGNRWYLSTPGILEYTFVLLEQNLRNPC